MGVNKVVATMGIPESGKVVLTSDGTTNGTSLTCDGVRLPVRSFTLTGGAGSHLIHLTAELIIDRADFTLAQAEITMKGMGG